MSKSLGIPAAPLEGELIPKDSKKKVARGYLEEGKRLPVTKVDKNKWEKLIALIADGNPIADTLVKLKITRQSFEAAIRTNDVRNDQYREAKLASMRRAWSQELIDDVLVAIAMGATVDKALEQNLVIDKRESFYRLVLNDPIIKAEYDEARRIQAEKMAIDDILQIADDRENDETWDGKPNSAAVNRDRLRTDARKWIAARIHHKRFGDKIDQNINANIVVDHAARLEAARKRKAGITDTEED